MKNKSWSLKFIALAIIICLLINRGGFNFASAESLSPKDNSTVCAVYFTYAGCPNCAYTDPLVLTEWTKKHPNLAVIEYMWWGGDWENPNSQFFGEYAQEYHTQAAVPQLVFDKENIKLGRLDVPKGEENIKTLTSNPCSLINKSVFWENLDLNELKAKPKIWTDGRILIKLDENNWLFQWNGQAVSEDIIGDKNIDNQLAKDLLFADSISESLKGRKFEIAEPQKAEFSGSAFPNSEFIAYQEFENAIKINPVKNKISNGVNISEEPIGKGPATEEEIELPIIGKIKTEEFSLPALTFLLGIADGLNPCAFFILTFLLAALLGLGGARRKILLVGGIFIFLSALFYFLFMSVLLNVFKLGQEITVLTFVAGAIAVFAGVINIKDYFFFQKGISLTLPKDHKAKFMERVKNLSLAKSTFALIAATVVIAATVNIYELLCTFGFPMIYTRILTLRELPSLQYYLYLIFYNLVYITPLAVIVLIFAITLGKRTFSQIWVKRLKLISGFMILSLGSILILKPKLLESIFTAFGVLFGAVVISGLIILIDSFRERKHEINKLMG